MNRAISAVLLSIIVAAQAVVAGIAGFGVMNALPAGSLPQELVLAELELGGLGLEEAEALILENPQLSGLPDSVKINIDGEIYDLDAKSLNIQIDEASLRNRLAGFLNETSWERLQNNLTENAKKDIRKLYLPLIADPEALELAGSLVAAAHDVEPSDAQATMKDLELVVTPSANGRRLNQGSFVSWVTAALREGVQAPGNEVTLALDLEDQEVSELLPPEIHESDYAGLLLAGSSETPMVEGFYRDAEAAASSITNRWFIYGETLNSDEWIAEVQQRFMSKDTPTRVASALFSAFLAVPQTEVVERQPSPQVTSFAAPGQEALAGTQGDLVLRNATNRDLLVMADNIEETLILAVFSDRSGSAGVVFSDVVETTEPELVQIPSEELAEGDVRVIKAGRAGLTVNVYRIEGGNRTLLHTDVYLPRDRVLEVGTRGRVAIEKYVGLK